jgi:DNA-binding beta-propeller fold protein YncE
VTVDPSGDLFIADTANCRLRMVAASSGSRFGMTVVQGDIYTVAGTGICGSQGDGGPALGAELWDPGALAVDAGGDVLVADQGNRTIRVLTSHSGTFYGVALVADDLGTVAGEGSYGPYLVDGLSAVGETAELNFPTAIAVDAHGNLYIADGAIHAIRLVPASTTTLLGKAATADNMYTVAGAMSTDVLHSRTEWIQTRMLDPAGLALTPGGQLVYSDGQADVVRRLPAGI